MRKAMRRGWAYIRSIMAALVIGTALGLLLLMGTEQQLASLRGVVEPKDLAQLQFTARGIQIQILAMVFVLVGLLVWARRMDLAQENQVTERFTRAIEHLGSERTEICLGGIYALEQIAKESARYHGPIMEILTAFVRDNSPWRPEVISSPRRLATEIQVILTVLGRRNRSFEEDLSLDLSQTDVRRANLRDAHLEGANLVWAHLDMSDLSNAHLGGAYLVRASLDGAVLKGTHLQGADLSEALLTGADLSGARLEGACLLGAIGLTEEQLGVARTDGKTLLPDYLLSQELRELG